MLEDPSEPKPLSPATPKRPFCAPLILRLPDRGQPEPELSVSHVIDAYLANLRCRLKVRQLSKATLSQTAFYLASFRASFGRQRIGDCLRGDVMAWLADNPQWKSDATRRNAMGCVLSCFRWAEDEELIDATPYRKPREIRFRPCRRKPMGRSHAAALMRAAAFRTGRRKCPSGRAFRRSVFFLRRTGCRPCEMRSARWDQMEWEQCAIRQSLHKTDRSADAERLIGLDPAVMRLLRNLYLRRAPGQTHIFLNGRGRPWSKDGFAELFLAFARRAGIPKGLTSYCLRHGWVTCGIELGEGERQLADAVGHSGTRYVSWYAHQTRTRAKHLQRIVTRVARGKPEQ